MVVATAQETWRERYRKKNDKAPPPIYEELNTIVSEAQPWQPGPSQRCPKLPSYLDFPKNIELQVLDFNGAAQNVQQVIIVLHNYGSDLAALGDFSKKHLLGPRTACIVVRGIRNLECGGSYCWSDEGDFVGGKKRALQYTRTRRQNPNGVNQSNEGQASGARDDIEDAEDEEEQGEDHPITAICEAPEEEACSPTFTESTNCIGIEIITKVLIKQCGFRPGNIAIVGHDQGGTAALAVAAACWQTKFGGVVSIGGGLQSDFPSDFPNYSKARTNVLLLGGQLGDLNPKEVARIKTSFSRVENALKADKDDDLDAIDEEKLAEFLAHQLGREEWTKETVITFGESC